MNVIVSQLGCFSVVHHVTDVMLVQVAAGSSAEYTLIYKPFTMTADEQPHEGSVFFPIPDGSGLLYKLHGQVGIFAGSFGSVMLADRACHDAFKCL